ncbi:hypothetical protein ASPZODRAFT_1838082 [Penicilliopsis zonata CBS 506.65]|uniref:Uncharacterized protein n=1 Tax=Penicilliopsis zonata CBS 506.65 TaxID=1073090 RepID=A0A1L9SI99_9EURO|nr:hypothetical protein ASPZODRAFT_1838082 [Penicilliopsis zonata CBS 506.65]OJJ46867.1 hypothetical protein ASPZODRAFT_1838082 [Penicilliopsis zonata CBS 506.65]
MCRRQAHRRSKAKAGPSTSTAKTNIAYNTSKRQRWHGRRARHFIRAGQKENDTLGAGLGGIGALSTTTTTYALSDDLSDHKDVSSAMLHVSSLELPCWMGLLMLLASSLIVFCFVFVLLCSLAFKWSAGKPLLLRSTPRFLVESTTKTTTNSNQYAPGIEGRYCDRRRVRTRFQCSRLEAIEKQFTRFGTSE